MEKICLEHDARPVDDFVRIDELDEDVDAFEFNDTAAPVREKLALSIESVVKRDEPIAEPTLHVPPVPTSSCDRRALLMRSAARIMKSPVLSEASLALASQVERFWPGRDSTPAPPLSPITTRMDESDNLDLIPDMTLEALPEEPYIAITKPVEVSPPPTDLPLPPSLPSSLTAPSLPSDSLQEFDEIWTLIELLLTIYDKCKGMKRSVLGDTDAIVFLRSMLKLREPGHLLAYDFTPFAYDYTRLHAHTVAIYSLSTLIMRIVSHRLWLIVKQEHIPHINRSVCQLAEEKSVFASMMDCGQGIPFSAQAHRTLSTYYLVPTEALHNTIDTVRETFQPSHAKLCPRCSRCCDKFWTKYAVCFDCALRKVCYGCGALCQRFARNTLPICQTCQLSF